MPSAAFVLGAVLIGCSSGCGAPSEAQGAANQGAQPPADDDSIAVQIGPVSRVAVSALYTTSATLRADKQATITARTSGVVKQLLVEEGDWVETGQVLAVLEDDEQKIEQDRTAFAAETKEREFARAQKLHEQGLLSDEEYETTRRDTEEARQNAEMASLMFERTRIRASFGGRITKRYLDVGNTVSSGTAVYDVADLDPLYADVNVPERHIARLDRGQGVRLIADASGTQAPAAIERIAPVVDPSTGTVKVTLAVRQDADLRPGSFVRVEIVTDTHDRALVVPRSALVAEGRRWHVFRVSEDGAKVERLEVTRGYEEGDRVEIAETNDPRRTLAEGDRVVVVGASALTDGSTIRVIDAPESSKGSEANGKTRVAA